VTITFNPWGANDPIGYTPEPYDPARLEENWQFIRDVRPVVKQYGPPTTRFDLLNEGGADFWQPQLLDYDVELWTRYVDEFGHGDATISVITNPGTPGGSGSRLQNFIPALRATGGRCRRGSTSTPPGRRRRSTTSVTSMRICVVRASRSHSRSTSSPTTTPRSRPPSQRSSVNRAGPCSR
jgi:hypothetical protein